MKINTLSQKYYLGFSYFNKIGPQNLQKLENYFPNLNEAFYATSFDLEQAGLSSKLVREFIAWRPAFNLTETLADLEKKGINFVTWQEQAYPKILREISAPPRILYFQGVLNKKTKNRLAVVGSRKHSAYAEKIIKELLPNIVKSGIEIVSGLALGVDSLAHQIAIDNQGTTIAVLGSGLNSEQFYPPANRQLAEDIIKSGGALISEFSPNTPPLKQNFPQRNRLISGLSQATLVIEAKTRSGSLITANYALEQNREVAAVPGNIFSEFSTGTNNLIAAGAKVITKTEDLLDIFKIENTPLTTTQINLNKAKKYSNYQANYQAENKHEELIYKLLKTAQERAEKISTDDIIKKSKLSTAIVNSTLSILEIKGLAKNDEFGYYLN